MIRWLTTFVLLVGISTYAQAEEEQSETDDLRLGEEITEGILGKASDEMEKVFLKNAYFHNTALATKLDGSPIFVLQFYIRWKNRMIIPLVEAFEKMGRSYAVNVCSVLEKFPSGVNQVVVEYRLVRPNQTPGKSILAHAEMRTC